MKLWHEVYRVIAENLCKLYNELKQPDNVGSMLYDQLTKNKSFIDNNKWINTFNKDFGEASLDPLHIFSSISIRTKNIKEHLARINVILDLFELDEIASLEDVNNFVDWPDVKSNKLLFSRRKEEQEIYWKILDKVINSPVKRVDIIKDEDLDTFEAPEINTLTFFLFWIDSDNFLPLDSYTKEYLKNVKVLNETIFKYSHYIYFLEELETSCTKVNGNIESGLYREIAKVAYNNIHKSVTIPLSTSLHKLIKKYAGGNYGGDESDVVTSNAMGFKIIAIKVLDECDSKLINNLNKGTLFYFEKAFNIDNDKIEFNPNKEIRLFDSHDIKINVTAIVGKNGSGKSSLFELLYQIINNIAYKHKTELHKVDLIHNDGLHAELFYLQSGRIFKIVLKDKIITVKEFEFISGCFYANDKDVELNINHFYNFFYTIVVNYSHYALNSLDIGEWVQKLFHKNDSYQTPVVINPMRSEGNIDINVEKGLLYSRLISNLLSHKSVETKDEYSQVTEKQRATAINYSLKINEQQIVYKNIYKDIEVKYDEISIADKVIKYIKLIINHQVDEESIVWKESVIYFIKKLIRIGITYPKYYDFIDAKTFQFYDINFEEYVNSLLSDPTHISYKFKQIINYWKHPDLWPRTSSFSLEIDEETIRLNNFISNMGDSKLIELIPPSIFKQEITLLDGQNNQSDFERLSSGEKQLIHSINSIIYHIRNLDSIVPTTDTRIYENINIILDEIELYYHPEMQRKFISSFMRFLTSLELNRKVSINMCLITHSPYILSDIPNYYTLNLVDGSPKNILQKSFGANIHDLLANDFFMENGFMGEFAKTKIEEIIIKLNLKKLKTDYDSNKGSSQKIIQQQTKEAESLVLKLFKLDNIKNKNFNHFFEMVTIDREAIKNQIDIIGEPIIRNKLLQMYAEAFQSDNEEKKRLEFEAMAEELGAKINYIKN